MHVCTFLPIQSASLDAALVAKWNPLEPSTFEGLHLMMVTWWSLLNIICSMYLCTGYILAASIWLDEWALSNKKKSFCHPSFPLLFYWHINVALSQKVPADHSRLSNTLFNHRPQSRLFMMNNLSQWVPKTEFFFGCMYSRDCSPAYFFWRTITY